MEVERGKKYRIKKFKVRPPHWSENGEMDQFMGQTVTITSTHYGRRIVYADITGTYYLYKTDFEPIDFDWDE